MAQDKPETRPVHLQIDFEPENEDQQEMLCALLFDFGFEGAEQCGSVLRAYMPAGQFDAHAFGKYLRQFPEAARIPFRQTILPGKNWNEVWERSYEAVAIAGKVRIRASFHAHVPEVPYDLLIDPKMSFGTGHHATTQLMIEMMLGMDFQGKSILDFGSGTGVLSILAHKMKAKRVLAVDIDQWAFENIRENIKINQAENIEPRIGSGDAIANEQFDAVLANVNKNIISENMELLACALIRNGIILFSGLLENDETYIVNSARSNGLILKEKKTKNEWLCLMFAKP